MLGPRVTRTALLAFLALAVLGCSIFRGVVASASCAGVSPAAIRATLESEPGADVRDAGDGTSPLEVWATRDEITTYVRVMESPPELLLEVGSYGGLPEGVDDDDLIRRAKALTALLSASHPEIGQWQLEVHAPGRGGGGALSLVILAAILVGLLAVPVGAIWLVIRLNAKTRARKSEPPDASA